MNLEQRIVVDRQNGPPRGPQERQARRQKLAQYEQHADSGHQHDDHAMHDRRVIGIRGYEQKGAVKRRVERRPDNIDEEPVSPFSRGLKIAAGIAVRDVLDLPDTPDDLALEQQDQHVAGPRLRERLLSESIDVDRCATESPYRQRADPLRVSHGPPALSFCGHRQAARAVVCSWALCNK